MSHENINITVGRRDSLSLAFQIWQDEEQSKAESLEGWTIYFTVKDRAAQFDSDALVSKTIAGGGSEFELELLTTDTDIPPKDYYYDIRFLDAEGRVGTLVSRARFKVYQPIRHFVP